MVFFMQNNLRSEQDFEKDIHYEIKQYPQKKQIKVFIKIMHNKNLAKVLFENMYKLHSIPIYSTPDYILFQRKMRAYLVKDEATLERLATEKFDEDLLRN
jgi:hypothetical protein